MGPLIPIIVVIYLVASVVSAVLQSMKKEQPTRIPKIPPAPPRPQAPRRREAQRPEVARTQPAAPVAPAAPKPAPVFEHQRPRVHGSKEADYGSKDMAGREEETDLAVDAVWDEFGTAAPRISAKTAAKAQSAEADILAAGLASQLWAVVILSEVLREPRAVRPWPVR